MHLAAAKGDKGLVSLLLARGADARAKTKDGKTYMDLLKEHKKRASKQPGRTDVETRLPKDGPAPTPEIAYDYDGNGITRR